MKTLLLHTGDGYEGSEKEIIGAYLVPDKFDARAEYDAWKVLPENREYTKRPKTGLPKLDLEQWLDERFKGASYDEVQLDPWEPAEDDGRFEGPMADMVRSTLKYLGRVKFTQVVGGSTSLDVFPKVHP